MHILFFILFLVPLEAHNGHLHTDQIQINAWMHWLGQLHPILLHFPIALLLTGALCEYLFWRTSHTIFDQAARVLILGAALTVLPTAFFGYALSYDVNYGEVQEIFEWHRALSLLAVFLVILTAYFREYYRSGKLFILCLLLSSAAIIATSVLGGIITFGTPVLWPE